MKYEIFKQIYINVFKIFEMYWQNETLLKDLNTFTLIYNILMKIKEADNHE